MFQILKIHECRPLLPDAKKCRPSDLMLLILFQKDASSSYMQASLISNVINFEKLMHVVNLLDFVACRLNLVGCKFVFWWVKCKLVYRFEKCRCLLIHLKYVTKSLIMKRWKKIIFLSWNLCSDISLLHLLSKDSKLHATDTAVIHNIKFQRLTTKYNYLNGIHNIRSTRILKKSQN